MKYGMKPLFVSLAASFVVLLAACSPEGPAEPAAPPAPAADAPAPAEPTMAPTPQAAVQEQSPIAAAQEISEVDDQETVGEAPAAGSLQLRGLSPVASAQAQPARFQQGVNYSPLVPAQPTSVSPGQVEAVEVFWYGCQHCFALDPSLESWRKSGKAPYIQFVRIPAMWNDLLKVHARLFYTIEALGKLDEVHASIFREIHSRRNMLDTTDKIVTFLKDHGVTAQEYQKAATSFAVESKLRRAEELNRRYKVQGVPMIVINGKWTADVGSAGGNQQLVQLIDEVAARERGN